MAGRNYLSVAEGQRLERALLQHLKDWVEGGANVVYLDSLLDCEPPDMVKGRTEEFTVRLAVELLSNHKHPWLKGGLT